MSKVVWTADEKQSTGELLGSAGSRRRSSRMRQLNSDNRLKTALSLSALFWYTLFTWYLPSSGCSTPLRQAYSRYTALFSQLSGEESSIRNLAVADAIVLVTAKHPGGYAAVQLPAPFNTELLHIVTSIHPKKGLEATQEYQATSLLQLKGGEPTDLTFFCNFGNMRYPAEITMLQQFPLVAASTLTVECDLPPWSRSLQPGASLEEHRQVLRYMMSGSYALTLEWQSKLHQEVKGAFARPHWTMPKHKSILSACTEAISLDSNTTAADLIEWRVHHFLQGIETVHWYGQNAKLEKWVATLSEHLGVRDSFTHAPDLATPSNIYSSIINNDLWYQDCLLRHSFHDEWLIRLSIKQYVQYDGTSSIKSLLEKVPANVAGVEVSSSRSGGERLEAAPYLDGYPDSPRTARTRYGAQPTSSESNNIIHRPRGIVSVAAIGGSRIVDGFTSLHRQEANTDGLSTIRVIEAGESVEERDYEQVYTPSEKVVALWQEEARYLRALHKLLQLPLV